MGEFLYNLKQTMRKIILTISASIMLTQIALAQDAKTIGSSTASNKRFALSLGITAAIGLPDGGNGGHLKLDYLIKPKLGLGIKIIGGGLHYDQSTHYDATFYEPDLTVTYKSSLNLISDLTVTYYILGNYTESKGGLYADLGVGYHLIKSNLNDDYTGSPTITETIAINGLGAHLSLGGSYKIGRGKIYLELMSGSVLYGTYSYDRITPENTKIGILAKENYESTSYKSAAESHPAYTNYVVNLLALNLGYSICF
jgi:hypothetical protein